MRQGQDRKRNVRRHDGQTVRDRKDVGNEVVVREHYAFGLTGGAGGVDDRRQVISASARNQCVESRWILALNRCAARFNAFQGRGPVETAPAFGIEDHDVLEVIQSFKSLTRMLEHATAGTSQTPPASVPAD